MCAKAASDTLHSLFSRYTSLNLAPNSLFTPLRKSCQTECLRRTARARHTLKSITVVCLVVSSWRVIGHISVVSACLTTDALQFPIEEAMTSQVGATSAVTTSVTSPPLPRKVMSSNSQPRTSPLIVRLCPVFTDVPLCFFLEIELTPHQNHNTV